MKKAEIRIDLARAITNTGKREVRSLSKLAAAAGIRLSQSLDDSITASLFTGTTTTTATKPEPEPITIDKINRLMATAPKPHVFLSSKLFPLDKAWHVEGGREKFTLAHPHFWLRVEHDFRRVPAPKANPLTNPILPFGIRIIEIDIAEDEDDDRRKYLEGYWDRLKEAVEVASVPLPEWLRSAPKFSTHG